MANTLIREAARALDHHRPIRLLADLAGRPRPTARSWATGHRRPPLPILKTLLEVLRQRQAERTGVAPLEERQTLSGLAYELDYLIRKRSYEVRRRTGFNEIRQRDGPGSAPRDGRNRRGRPKRIRSSTYEPVNDAGESR
jgi:hypothetical protein